MPTLTSLRTSNPLDFFVASVTVVGWDVGTFDSKIFDDTTQPYYGQELVTFRVTSEKVTESALVAFVGMAHGATRKAIYDSGLQERVTSVAGLRAGVDMPGLLVLSRGNRSWVGTAMLTDISGRSRHGFSEGDVLWIGGGRATFQGGSGEIISTPHNTAHTPAQPRIEARVRLPFDGPMVLVDKGSYVLEVDGDALVYTYVAGGVTHDETSDSLQQHGFKARQDLIVAVEHLNNPTTRIRFLTSLDGETFNVLGQDIIPGATHVVDDSTNPIVIGPGEGEVFWVKVKDAANGAVLAHADLFDVPAAGISWGSMTGETWTVMHSLPSTEPETVLGVEPEEWGINLRGDIVKTPTTLEVPIATGATVAVSLDILENPLVDTTLLSNEERPSEFSIIHTALGLFRVLLGGRVYEKPATVGEPVITVAFDAAGADVYLDGSPFDLVVDNVLPSIVGIAPSQIGKGSTDDDDYLYTGVVILDHRATEAERDALRAMLVA